MSASDVVSHPSVQVSAGVAVMLATASFLHPMPWWIWAGWAMLSVISVVQASGLRHEDDRG